MSMHKTGVNRSAACAESIWSDPLRHQELPGDGCKDNHVR